jgi:putative oxidoreductase
VIRRFLDPKTEVVYAFLRIVAGVLFAFHGLQKTFGVLTDARPAVGTQIWFGGIIELVTGLAVGLGVVTPWAASLASGTMAVAYVQFHWKLDFGARFFPAVNEGELAVVYAWLFLFIACRGGGRCSLDRRLTGKARSQNGWLYSLKPQWLFTKATAVSRISLEARSIRDRRVGGLKILTGPIRILSLGVGHRRRTGDSKAPENMPLVPRRPMRVHDDPR